MPIDLTFGVFENSFDRIGRTIRMPWESLATRCVRSTVGTKDGSAIACADFHGTRAKANLNSRCLIALDVETSQVTGEIPLPPQEIAAYLTRRKIAAVLWTTHSHEISAPRYRVLMPLSRALSCAEMAEADPMLAACAAVRLQIFGVCDPSKFGASSLFYLPRIKHESSPFYSATIEGDAVDADLLRNEAILNHEQAVMDEAQRLALKRHADLPPEIAQAIAEYNSRNQVQHLLERYGYLRSGRGRWKSRYQHGQGATTVLPDGGVWVSFSESDAAAGVGMRPSKRSSQCACWGDAFALFVHYENRGNFRTALEKIRHGAGHGSGTS